MQWRTTKTRKLQKKGRKKENCGAELETGTSINAADPGILQFTAVLWARYFLYRQESGDVKLAIGLR